MNDTFRDYIPADEDPGAIGDGGFTDYVPEPKPQRHDIPTEQPQPAPPVTPVPPLEPQVPQQPEQPPVQPLNPFTSQEGTNAA